MTETHTDGPTREPRSGDGPDTSMELDGSTTEAPNRTLPGSRNGKTWLALGLRALELASVGGLVVIVVRSRRGRVLRALRGESAWKVATGLAAAIAARAVRTSLFGRRSDNGTSGYGRNLQRGLATLLGAADITLHASGLSLDRAVGALEGSPAARPSFLKRLVAKRLSRSAAAAGQPAEAAITIGRDPEEVHRFLRDPNNLRAVLGSLRADANIIEDQPGQLLRWRSSPDTELQHEGSAEFRRAPADRGTEVRLRLHFQRAGAVEGLALAGSVPDLLAMRVLRGFKSLIETGELPTTAPQPAARSDRG
jgi:hypothetical protein